MDSRFKFEQLQNGDVVEFGFSTVSWTTVADRFYDFLLGSGFVLDKQDLADYYDQSCFQQDRQSDADCDQSCFNDRVDDVIEEHRDALDRLDEGPANFAERFDQAPDYANPQTKFANPEPTVRGPDQTVPRLIGRKLYEFTVSDSGSKTITLPEIWSLAQRSAAEQLDFEINCGGTEWPPHHVVMTGCVINDTSDGLMYSFEVLRV